MELTRMADDIKHRDIKGLINSTLTLIIQIQNLTSYIQSFLVKSLVVFFVIFQSQTPVYAKGQTLDAATTQQLQEKRQRLLNYLSTIKQFQSPSTKEGKKGIERVHEFLSGKQTDLKESVLLLKKAVEAYDSEAMVWLSQIYLQGLGGSTLDKDRAQALLEKASQLGNASGTYHLGLFHYEQQSGFGDLSKAISLIEQSDRKGYPLAATALGKIALFSGKDTEAKKYFEQGIQQGDLEAMVTLSGMYQSGNYFPDHNNRGLTLLEKAWEQGWHDAGLKLYTTYLNGQGVKKDTKKALNFLRETAAMGSGDAYAFLCSITAGGDHGVKKDIDKAIELCETGMEFNSIIAPHNLAINLFKYFKYFKDEKSLTRAKQLVLLATKKGNPASMANVALRILSKEDLFFKKFNNDDGYGFLKMSAEIGWPQGMLFLIIASNDVKEKDIPKLKGPDYKTCWYWASILQGISPGQVSSSFIDECGAELTQEFKQSKEIEIKQRIQFYQRNRWTNDYLRLIRSGMRDLNQG